MKTWVSIQEDMRSLELDTARHSPRDTCTKQPLPWRKDPCLIGRLGPFEPLLSQRTSTGMLHEASPDQGGLRPLRRVEQKIEQRPLFDCSLACSMAERISFARRRAVAINTRTISHTSLRSSSASAVRLLRVGSAFLTGYSLVMPMLSAQYRSNLARLQSIRDHQQSLRLSRYQSLRTHDAIAEIVGKQALYTLRRICHARDLFGR